MESVLDIPLFHALPQPPRLHWVLALLLDVVTWGMFELVWIVVQVKWVRRVKGRSLSMSWAMVYASMLPALAIFMVTTGILGVDIRQALTTPLAMVAEVAFLVIRFMALFALRKEFADDPINMPTSALATFFFGTIYFQYHLHSFHYDGTGRSHS